MSLLPEPLPSLGEVAAALLAGAGGRALLLARAARENITWRRLLTLLVYELPLIAASAGFGGLVCLAAGIEGSLALVIIGVLANKGPAVIEPIVSAAVEALVAALRRSR